MVDNRKNFAITGILFLAFVIFTALIMNVDVRAIGPKGSSVGFAALNGSVHDAIGVHITWFKITEILGGIALIVALFFAVIGVCQLIYRKSLLRVDKDIYILGLFYILVIIAYCIFEVFTVNYRPVVLDGTLEASYPSSHTMLSCCIFVTAMMQFHHRISTPATRRILNAVLTVFLILTVVGRLISGVHWFTDIIGGVLLSAALIMLYYSLVKKTEDSGKVFRKRR